jgi:hypothetical protein
MGYYFFGIEKKRKRENDQLCQFLSRVSIHFVTEYSHGTHHHILKIGRIKEQKPAATHTFLL